ncbi:tetratricopeptide repeat protein [Shewanella sp. 10N.286.48.A6]|uniref:tetratricopeptide repeat protein n=1 Tax=Shewanella sp. 10N.286.48.A6 TaxID=1880833 RepID=UPI000C82C3FF|nr:tetratricopeptide repeat protein [Shewanella sp. 10N.286.48.A6]PMI03097.1 hypothetical protein BCU55_05940 [Shewanella sp. 10N.286.48.A6]
MNIKYDEISLWGDAVSLVKEEKYDQAIFLFRCMVKKGVYEALVEIGYLYEMPSSATIQQNYEKAAAYYRKAIELCDDVYAYTSLGRLYFFGVGVQQDYLRAKNLYTKASDKGGVVAKLMLARFYRYGYGMPKNIATSKKYYELAVQAGSHVALKESGLFDIEQGKLITGLMKVLKGTVMIFLGVRKDLSNYGVIVSENIKNQ